MAHDDEPAPDAAHKSVTSLESLRALYLAERQRRESIRSQLAIPVSVVSFSIFGYVAFAQYFDVSRTDVVTLAMDLLILLSLSLLFAAMVYLARVEHLFTTHEIDTLEDVDTSETEYPYFQRAYLEARRQNAEAARLRARGFQMLLVALACFVLAVALLPFHLDGTGVNGRARLQLLQANGIFPPLPRRDAHPQAAPVRHRARVADEELAQARWITSRPEPPRPS